MERPGNSWTLQVLMGGDNKNYQTKESKENKKKTRKKTNFDLLDLAKILPVLHYLGCVAVFL